MTEKSAQSLTWNAKNSRKEALTSEVGSGIAASGEVQMMAGNDFNIKGLSATSDNGAISLAAGKNVNTTQKIDEGYQTSGSSGGLFKTTVTTRYLVDQSQ